MSDLKMNSKWGWWRIVA